MKKKLAIILVAVTLVVALSIALTSCNMIKGLIPGGDDGDEINISSDYDYSKIEENVNEMKTNGIYIEVKVTGESDDSAPTEEYYTYGAKGDIYYYSYGEEKDQTYYDLTSDEYYVTYTLEEENDELVWNKTITAYSEYMTKDQAQRAANLQGALVWSWFGYYANAGSGNGTKTTTTIAGRSCDKYEYNTNVAVVGAAASVKQIYCVDKETGVCLKYSVTGSAVSTDGSSSGSYAMECKKFQTNWTPELPTVDAAHTHDNTSTND